MLKSVKNWFRQIPIPTLFIVFWFGCWLMGLAFFGLLIALLVKILNSF